MDKDGIHSFFTAFSRLIPVVAVVVVIIGIALRYHVFDRGTVSVKPTGIMPSPRIKSVTDIFGGARKTSGLDPVKDFSCLYSDKTASISAYKKGGDMMIRHSTPLEKKYYLVKGDCLYVWKEGIYEGQKICGIGNDMALIQTVLSTGLLNANSLVKVLPENLPVPSGSAIPVGQIQKILKTCVNRDVTEADIPMAPKNIVFSEKKK